MTTSMADGTTDDLVLAARWIFPVSAPPLERGTVTVRGERVAAVEPHGERSADVDLGNSAVVPGFVNAHTHLDLSHARGLLSPTGRPPTEWLRDVISFRLQQSAVATGAAVRLGLEESIRFGTTLVADVTAGGASWGILQTAPTWSDVFHEFIGLRPERAAAALANAAEVRRKPAGRCRPAFGPHAPYSFRFQTLQDLARLADIPLSIHLAEFREELELLDTQAGPFVPFLVERDAWDPTGLAPSIEAVLRACDRGAPVVFAHGNYLSPTASIPRNATVVYCPRTHAAFGHPTHPFRALLDRGVRVALGTDSLASNPDLDLLAEARFLAERHPEVRGEVLLRMATLSGAEALGRSAETGSLSPGKSADLVIVPLPDEAGDDPHDLLLQRAEPSGQPRRSMWQGRWRSGHSGGS